MSRGGCQSHQRGFMDNLHKLPFVSGSSSPSDSEVYSKSHDSGVFAMIHSYNAFSSIKTLLIPK